MICILVDSVQVWQFPVVLAPLSPLDSSDESIILRPVDSTEVLALYPKPQSHSVPPILSQLSLSFVV